MNLSARTIERLIEIITGNTDGSPYRTGAQLVAYFRDFDEDDHDEENFPSRAWYVHEKLCKFQGMETMEKIVSDAFHFFDEDGFSPEEQAEAFNHLLVPDGYQLVLEYRPGVRKNDKYPYFEIRTLVPDAVIPNELVAISHDAIKEQIAKAKKRLEAQDFAGVIASSYTLVEHLLKLMLEEAGVSFKENEGDIRSLYKSVREPLNLNPRGDSIAAPLKPLLDGFQKLVSGLYEVSNKASDRHARRYEPAAHHAKLAINAAVTLCEFLVESRDYQKVRQESSVHQTKKVYT